MKNKALKEKLNNYADSLQRKEEILYAAYHAMDKKRIAGAYDTKNRLKMRFGLAGFAAAAVIFVVIIGVIFNNIQGASDSETSVNPYSLDSLQMQTVSQQDYCNLTDVLYFAGGDGQADGRFFIYVNDKNEIYAARAIYRVIRDGNVDDITIISDFKNNLIDYEENKPSKNYSVIRYFDVYQNGEYHSYLAALSNNKTYYITIASPSRYAGEYYENILL